MRLLRLVGLRCAAPFAVACAFVLTNPSLIALQDVSALLTGADSGAGERWMMHVNRSGAGSIHQGELQFGGDATITGSIERPGEPASSMSHVAIVSEKSVLPDTPDEARVNRAGKAGRIAAVIPSAPPRDFSAGSIFERQSSLLRPTIEQGVQMAFAKPGIVGRELQIAAAFHKRAPMPVAPELPRMVAELVNNPMPDILATAYAPPEPDFATQSPFASLLKNDDQARGRFIPPVPDNDHFWATRPLPAHAFSNREQKCLAEGIYFEARGEIARGQVAVAQVILNRVRNPAFPNTICGVVYQNRHWRNRCQFSFACDGIRDRITEQRQWKTAQDIAMASTAGKIWLEEVGSSTHYHATYVNPRWAHRMKRLTRIGLHIFYRTYNGGWS